ncbi:helix-turn-helix domain-containing protein [Streptomyces sp. NPDC002044]|uniref:helix-turn-helix domain-containing protein n=1 Tax=Streptomyces sp. NPDC002044 TaxID=3154662 RepID=UPI00332BC3C4
MQTIGEPTRFGELLQQYRKRIGYTQTELSGFSTVSVRAIRNLELGKAKTPRRDTVRLLANTLRLGGEQRAALLLAAGHEADDASFDALPALPADAFRPLHGRAAEVGRLVERLRAEPRARAFVTGLGGVGKSRIALAAARILHTEDRMPVLWIPLAVGEHADGPGGAVGGHLPAAVSAGLLNGASGTAEVVRLIGDRPVLLVLDGDDTGRVPPGSVATLLENCRNLRVVETTRRPRGGPRDLCLPLLPLPLPGPVRADLAPDEAAAAAGPALAVLLDRAAELRADVGSGPQDLAHLLEICAHLDGVPRALESAAHWLQLSTPAELVRTARTEPHVVATPPAAADPSAGWVHEATRHAAEALSPAHRALLHRLAARDRPWTMEELATGTGTGTGAGTGLGEAAAAVHALLHSGLVRRRASARTIAFGVLHLVRGCLPPPEAAAPRTVPRQPVRSQTARPQTGPLPAGPRQTAPPRQPAPPQTGGPAAPAGTGRTRPPLDQEQQHARTDPSRPAHGVRPGRPAHRAA